MHQVPHLVTLLGEQHGQLQVTQGQVREAVGPSTSPLPHSFPETESARLILLSCYSGSGGSDPAREQLLRGAPQLFRTVSPCFEMDFSPFLGLEGQSYPVVLRGLL